MLGIHRQYLQRKALQILQRGSRPCLEPRGYLTKQCFSSTIAPTFRAVPKELPVFWLVPKTDNGCQPGRNV